MEPVSSEGIEEFRALVGEMRKVLEGGVLVAEPPPVAALRGAPAKDLEAVQSACTDGFRETNEALLYAPYQITLARFGRPDRIDDKGRLVWNARLGPNSHWSGLAITIREGTVVNVEWLPGG